MILTSFALKATITVIGIIAGAALIFIALQSDSRPQSHLPRVDLSPDAPFAVYPGVYVVEVETGVVRRLTDLRAASTGWAGPAASTMSWSPDGTSIAVARRGPDAALLIYDAYSGRLRREIAVATSSVEWLPGGLLAVNLAPGSGRDDEGVALVDPGRGDVRAFIQRADAINSRWAPDGSVLAYAPFPHEADGLWLIDGRAGTFTQLSPGPHARPQWSADGRFLYVYGWRESDQANGLKVFERTASGYRIVAFYERSQQLREAGVSPDGRWSALSSIEGRLVAHPLAQPGDLRILGQGTQPAWSPDSRWLAFVRDGEVWAVEVGSGVQRSLVRAALPVATEPRWSPDGRFVAFVATSGGGGGVYVMAADGGDARYLVPGFEPRFSPDGGRISFLYGEGGLGFNGALYTMSPEGTHIRRLAEVRTGDVASLCSGAGRTAWSPDGRLLAVTSGFAGSQRVLVVPADGAGPTVTHGPDASGATWSPDARRVAYAYAGASAPRCEVRIADALGVRVEAVIEGRGYARWSPDGRWLGLLGTNGLDMVVVPANEPGAPRVVAQGARFAWSPSGSRIAYQGLDDALWIVDAEGLTPPLLVNSIPRFARLSWSPDGRRILYSAGGDPGQVFVVEAKEGAVPRKLADGSDADWAPDGARIVFSR